MDLSPSAHQDTFCRDHLPPAEQWPRITHTLPELHYPTRLNCAHALLDDTIARLGADRPCLLTTNTTWTYGELRRHVNQTAALLTEELGLRPGNRVLLRGPNTPWLVACWLAVLKAGGVVVTTLPLLRPGELHELCALTRPDLALCDARHVDDLLAGAPDGLTVLRYGSTDAEDLTVRADRHPDTFRAVETAADDVALLAPTSGTTGHPKVTMHFHRDVLANSDTFARHLLRPTPDDVFLGTPPLAFTFGLGGLVVFPLHAGARTLLLEHATPPQLADAIAEFGGTVLFTAPTAYRGMLADGLPARLAGLRRCVSAGEPLPATVWQAFQDATGVRIIDGIGATELLHIFVSAADDDIRPGCTGRPVPGYQAAVLGPDGTPVPDGTPGRLAVTGPTGCRYLADPRQSAYVQHGWNVTGDCYLRDADGYFHYQARDDDMIISAGYNIAGPEVEQALLGHPDVLDCGVVGTPDPDRGQLVTAYVTPRQGCPATAGGQALLRAELQDFVKQAIAPYKYPRRVEFVDALPRTNTGKLQRFRLREQAARTATPAATEASDPAASPGASPTGSETAGRAETRPAGDE